MGNTEKSGRALKAIFSTATLNGAAALLMSADMGSLPASALYLYAALAGAWNKYQALDDSGVKINTGEGSGADLGAMARFLKNPSMTARILMAAALYNFADCGVNLVTGPEDEQAANALKAFGWACGFLGDNALRRLDAVNFTKGETLGGKPRSRLREAFNALTANPTIFYNGASMAFTMAILSSRGADGFSSLEGGLGMAALCVVLTGIGHAVRRTWQATKGDIETAQINDGVMNYCSSIAKATQGVVSFMSGKYWLAAAQAIFMASSLKVVHETRDALDRKTP